MLEPRRARGFVFVLFGCWGISKKEWCPGWDSNPHTFRYRFLRPTRLPFRHPGAELQYSGTLEKRRDERGHGASDLRGAVQCSSCKASSRVSARGRSKIVPPLREGILLELPKVLRHPGQPLKKVPPMDPQTVIALCAVFTVVLGMIGISRRK